MADQDIDSLLDDILSQPREPTAEGDENKPDKTKPVYQRKGAPQDQENQASESKPQESVVEPASQEDKLSKEELRARLKEKIKGGRRQQQLQEKKQKGKQPSFPLVPIYYCDASDCLAIMSLGSAKFCPVCQCYSYCSKECQLKDWTKHKDMCGKHPDDDNKAKLILYKKAKEVSDTLFNKFKDGNYMTVIHEVGDEVMAAMFTTIADKSNVLNWKQYIQNPIFTTALPEDIGILSKKVRAAITQHPDKKIFLLSVLLDRMKDQGITECVIRLFIADRYGETMNAPASGVIKKSVTKYQRKFK